MFIIYSVSKKSVAEKNQQPHRTKIESRVTKNTLCERIFNKKRWFDYICMKSILKTPFKNISMWIHLCKHFPERILQTTYTHTDTHSIGEREEKNGLELGMFAIENASHHYTQSRRVHNTQQTHYIRKNDREERAWQERERETQREKKLMNEFSI